MKLYGWYVLPHGYTADYVPYPDGVYWHLYFAGQRVNGGLAEDHEFAQSRACNYALQHEHGEPGPA